MAADGCATVGHAPKLLFFDALLQMAKSKLSKNGLVILKYIYYFFKYIYYLLIINLYFLYLCLKSFTFYFEITFVRNLNLVFFPVHI